MKAHLFATHLRSAPEAKGLANADSSLKGTIKQLDPASGEDVSVLRRAFYLSVPGRPGADRDKCINMDRDRKHGINLPR